MLNCHEIVAGTEALFEHELHWRQRIALMLHLAICVHCRRYVRQMRLLVSAIGAYRSDDDAQTRRMLQRLDLDQG